MQSRNQTIPEFCDTENVSRSTVYREIKFGRLKVIHVGRKVLVPIEFADEWRDRLKNEAA